MRPARALINPELLVEIEATAQIIDRNQEEM